MKVQLAKQNMQRTLLFAVNPLDVEFLGSTLGLPLSQEEEKRAILYPTTEVVLLFPGSMVSLVDFKCSCGLTGYAATAGGAMAVQSPAPEAVLQCSEAQAERSAHNFLLCVVSSCCVDYMANSYELYHALWSQASCHL